MVGLERKIDKSRFFVCRQCLGEKRREKWLLNSFDDFVIFSWRCLEHGWEFIARWRLRLEWIIFGISCALSSCRKTSEFLSNRIPSDCCNSATHSSVSRCGNFRVFGNLATKPLSLSLRVLAFESIKKWFGCHVTLVGKTWTTRKH